VPGKQKSLISYFSEDPRKSKGAGLLRFSGLEHLTLMKIWEKRMKKNIRAHSSAG
jgi:hypothetical protein